MSHLCSGQYFGAECYRLMGDTVLSLFRQPGKVLDGSPVAVPGVEVHCRINPCGIEPQQLLNYADAFKEALPVLDGQCSQARNAGADDSLVGDGWDSGRGWYVPLDKARQRTRHAAPNTQTQHGGKCPEFAHFQPLAVR